MLALILALLGPDPTSTPVELAATPAPLHGTLLTPDAPRAVAVILPGSGPTNRDGDSALGLKAGNLRLLAEGLAARGIATVRIDKRGIGESRAAGADERALRFPDYAADARAWAAKAAELTDRPCAWLIGHSEGALVAELAAQQPDRICGLVLVSGAGRPAGVILREQYAAADPALGAQADAVLDRLEAGETVEDAPPVLAAAFRPSVQPYVRSWLAQDPAALLAAYDGPVLIAQGSTDLQTGVEDARALAAARPDATLVIWEGVNHVWRVAPTDRAANIATYMTPDAPLADGVVDTVAEFILDRP